MGLLGVAGLFILALVFGFCWLIPLPNLARDFMLVCQMAAPTVPVTARNPA